MGRRFVAVEKACGFDEIDQRRERNRGGFRFESGKLADLILLDANPFDNIHNTETIWRTVKAGRLVDPDKLKRPE